MKVTLQLYIFPALLILFLFLSHTIFAQKNLNGTYTQLDQALQDAEMVKKLHLSRRGLDSLPDVFSSFVNLEEILLDHNQLKRIPPSILSLEHLKKLDLSYNSIPLLKIESKSLPQLEYINISNNNLEVIECLGSFSKLKTLNLEHNKLKKIPSGLLSSTLEILLISNNSLASLAKELPTLERLVIFNAASCGLTTLPSSLQKSKKLQILHLEFNSIKGIPDFLFEFMELEELYMKGNPLPRSEMDKIQEEMLPIMDIE